MIAKGKVIDSTGEILMGVNIYLTSNEDNFKYGTTSDENGDFEFDIKDGDEPNLVSFSYLGFKNVEIKASELSNSNVTLLESAEQLDEILIIATKPNTKEPSTPTPLLTQAPKENKLNAFTKKYGTAIASVSVLGLAFLLYKIKK